MTTCRPNEECVADETLPSPIVARLRELALQPGPQIDPLEILNDPEFAAVIAQSAQDAEVRAKRDWPGLCRYRAENAEQLKRGGADIVFLGDSITENWVHADPSLFSDGVTGRGVSGQTSAQILLRFYQDAAVFKPKVVHIMAGTNDILHGMIGGNDAMINNIAAMADIAKVNGIEVILAAIPPISIRPWRPDLKPANRIIDFNARLQTLSSVRNLVFADYFPVLSDSESGLRDDLGNDGVHPNRTGYAAMRAVADAAIRNVKHKQE